MNFQNIHTFTYQKTLLCTLLLLVLKIVESLQCILNITAKFHFLSIKLIKLHGSQKKKKKNFSKKWQKQAK